MTRRSLMSAATGGHSERRRVKHSAMRLNSVMRAFDDLYRRYLFSLLDAG